MIELNIFTNCTYNIENHKTILETFSSFCDTWGVINPTIYLDPNPINRKSVTQHYIDYIKNNIPESKTILTNSLYEGYVKAIETSKSEFAFMLEHDWVFKKENINNDLKEISHAMELQKIHHLKFNKYNNNDSHCPQCEYNCYEEFEIENLVYSTTRAASNNPHIINVGIYKKDIFKYLKRKIGSGGIEEETKNLSESNFAVYGGLNHKSTILHLDGRK